MTYFEPDMAPAENLSVRRKSDNRLGPDREYELTAEDTFLHRAYSGMQPNDGMPSVYQHKKRRLAILPPRRREWEDVLEDTLHDISVMETLVKGLGRAGMQGLPRHEIKIEPEIT